MSNLIVNIRFWHWHLQIGKNFSSISWSRNPHYDNLKGAKKIEVYEFFNLIK